MRYFICYLLLFSLLTGCCTDEYRYDGTTEVSLLERDRGSTTLGRVADTIRAPFIYDARLSYQLFSAVPVVRPAQLLLAYSCGESYDRRLIIPSVRVYLDRNFQVEGQPVFAGTDLVALLAGQPEFDTNGFVSIQSVDLQFGASFLERADFSPGTYTFTFEGQLDDGTPVSASTPVYLDL